MSFWTTDTRETSDLPADAPRGRVAERVLAAELLQEFRRSTETLTQFTERITHGVINNVLEVGTIVFGTSGMVTLSFAVPIGCIEVRNLGLNTITVDSSGGGMPGAPLLGRGVYLVPAGAPALINLASRAVTLYGTADEYASYQAFTRGAGPS
jgi:hypothetical protein